MFLKQRKYRCFHLPITAHSSDISLLAVYTTLAIWVFFESKLKFVVPLMCNEVAYFYHAFTQAYGFYNWTREIVFGIHFCSTRNVHIPMLLSLFGDTICCSLVICTECRYAFLTLLKDWSQENLIMQNIITK